MTREAGKGDTQRPTNWDHFSENFDRIFGKKLKDMTEEDFDKALGIDPKDKPEETQKDDV